MQLLKDLYAIHSPSGGEKKMRRFIKNWIKERVPLAEVVCKSGNIYVTKGRADTYPCLVAHTDQVQARHGKDFRTYIVDGKVFGFSPSAMEMQGLGADDKNGIWVCLKCLEKYDTLKCVFFWGEETGCQGSARADMAFFDDCRWVIQCDRRNGSDMITYISGGLCSREFVAAVEGERWGYAETTGLTTDVGQLKDNGLAVSCMNLSCGYHKPHTNEEYTDVAELENCLAFVEHIIEDVTDVYPHEDDGLTRYGYGWDYNWGCGRRDGHTEDELAEYASILYSESPDVTPEDVAWNLMYYSNKSHEELLRIAYENKPFNN